MKNTAILSLLLCSCCLKPTGLMSDSIPEGAIPFEYKIHTLPVIIIPGILNNDIPVRCYFETGWSPMSFSDSLASSFELKHDVKKLDEVLKPMKVRIGTYEQTYGKTNRALYLKRDFFKYKGNDVVMTPWTFFDKRIIEISHSKHYFRELPDTKNLSGYDVVKMEVDGVFLKIPVVVSIQGKKIKEFVAIDTGSGGGIEFISSIASKYAIKKDSTTVLGQLFLGLSPMEYHDMRIPADTVKVGNSFLTEGQEVRIALSKISALPFSGIIGLGFFNNFDMVFDLKTYNLYLKPIEKRSM
jgi:hypothetical protein